MLQKLPGDGGDEDGWQRASALFDTLTAQELLDWPVQRLLGNLFHEDDPQLLGDRCRILSACGARCSGDPEDGHVY
jgi:molecular chaperone Hsp33